MYQLSWIHHCIVTVIITSITLGFALIVPNISIVFGLLGGTTSSNLGFIIPGLFGLQLCNDLYPSSSSSSSVTTTGTASQQTQQQVRFKVPITGICSSKWKLKCISWLLLIGGIGIGVLSTAVTFYETFVLA
jgi:Transmembrane amino acid transporter protein